MASKKTRNKVSMPNLTENQIINLCIFFIIAFYIYLKIYITSRIGLSGAAYAFSAFDFIAIFIILLPYSLKHTVCKFLRVKIQSQQYKNARRFLYGSFVLVIIYSLIIISLTILLRNYICKEILINNSSELCLLFIVPSVLFVGVSSVIKGYIQAINNTGSLLIIEIIEKLAMIIGVIIFSNIFNNYGNKVAMVLISPEYKYAFGAAGSLLGISIGLFLSMILNIFIYKSSIRLLNKQTASKRIDDIYDIFGAIKNEIIKFIPPYFFIILFYIIAQTFFFRSMSEAGNSELITYQWGSYNGISINLILIPVLWIISKTNLSKDSLNIASRNNNISELRSKISSMLINLFSYVIPSFTFMIIVAPYIINGFLFINSDFAVKTIRFSSLLILLLPVCFSFIIILQAVNQPMILILNGIISLVLGVASLIIFVFIVKLSMNGIILASIISALVFVILNIGPIKKIIRTNINMNKAIIIPLISTVIAGIIIFLIDLLLSLFMPSVLIVLFSIVIYTIILFISYTKFKITTELTLKKSFLGKTLINLGKAFNLF